MTGVKASLVGLKSNSQMAVLFGHFHPRKRVDKHARSTVGVKTNNLPVERLQTNSKVFAHSRWDIIPVLAGVLHCAYFFGMFYLFPRLPLWIMLILGFIYSVSISWNINGVSHYFIHNPYFRSPLLNRLFSILESVTVGFSQIFYECIHMQHHKGNADRPNENGETIDWISIYKHGEEGEAEHQHADRGDDQPRSNVLARQASGHHRSRAYSYGLRAGGNPGRARSSPYRRRAN